jgi:hypothetical protein
LKKLLNKLANKIEGHFSIGNLTVYGDNAMHFGCHYWTKRWGYICWRLPVFCGIADKIQYGDRMRWVPLYFYLSPNATPWAATFMLGGRFSKTEKLCSKLRKIKLGHNFKYDSENEDYNYRVMRQINNLC